jgi:UPF0716 family protein affecting phage T7 exclusion
MMSTAVVGVSFDVFVDGRLYWCTLLLLAITRVLGILLVRNLLRRNV